MSFVRRSSTQRLLAITSAVVALIVIAAVVAASALSKGGTVPPPKPLATAVRDALTAPAVPGLTARIDFTEKLVDSSSLPSGSPLLKGAKGRLWASGDGRARLELQSDNGDAQIVLGTDTVSVYDQQSNTVYKAKLPAHDTAKGSDQHTPPTLTALQTRLADAMKTLQISGAQPSNVGGVPAYTVRVAPRHDGGLVGAAEIAWDAATGVPLRAAVYQQGSDKPVLQLAVSDLSYGAVSEQDLTATPPAGAKVTTVDLGDHGPRGGKGKDHRAETTGVKAVGAAIGFPLSAPDTLAGLPRQQVRLVHIGKNETGALVTYGQGLGGIAVLQTVKGKDRPAPKRGRDGERGGLPQIAINGATGEEVATALGTLVRFDRAGVQYTVVGSVPPAAAEAAARGL